MPSLTERKKWREKRKNLKEGGVVLVAEPIEPATRNMAFW